MNRGLEKILNSINGKVIQIIIKRWKEQEQAVIMYRAKMHTEMK